MRSPAPNLENFMANRDSIVGLCEKPKGRKTVVRLSSCCQSVDSRSRSKARPL